MKTTIEPSSNASVIGVGTVWKMIEQVPMRKVFAVRKWMSPTQWPRTSSCAR